MFKYKKLYQQENAVLRSRGGFSWRKSAVKVLGSVFLGSFYKEGMFDSLIARAVWVHGNWDGVDLAGEGEWAGGVTFLFISCRGALWLRDEQ